MGVLRYDDNSKGSTLFITKFDKMPIDGMTWPCWWFLGPIDPGQPWSANGEFDGFENPGSESKTKVSAHCQAGSGSCTAFNPSGITKDYGQGPWANSVAPVTYTLLWTGSEFERGNGFYVWRWCENPDGVSGCVKPPADVTSGAPDPSTWGTPFFSFPYVSSDKWSIANLLVSLQEIFVVQLCGWTGTEEENQQCQNDPTTWAPIIAQGGSFEVSSRQVYQSVVNTGGCSIKGCTIWWDG